MVDSPPEPHPSSSSLLWDDFSSVYYDPEVGCVNPIDQKVMKVVAATTPHP